MIIMIMAKIHYRGNKVLHQSVRPSVLSCAYDLLEIGIP